MSGRVGRFGSGFGSLFAAILSLAALACVAQTGDGKGGESGTQTLRVQVRLVSLYVNVTDARGAPVADLTRENFALFEDKQPQTIAIFEKQTSVPLSVALAIDTSGSTRKDLGPERKGASEFARALLPGSDGHGGKQEKQDGRDGQATQDRLALFDFNSEVRQVVPFTNSVKQVEGGLGGLSKGPATALYSAIVLAAQALEPHSGRKVLVLVSDGENTVAGTSFDEALEEAQRDDVMIYTLIDVPIEADAGRDTAGEHAMIVLSQETGGRALYVNQGGLEAALKKVSDELRTQYLLGYYPRSGTGRNGPLVDPLAGPDAFRAVRVDLQGLAPGVIDTAHYRSGYYRSPTPH